MPFICPLALGREKIRIRNFPRGLFPISWGYNILAFGFSDFSTLSRPFSCLSVSFCPAVILRIRPSNNGLGQSLLVFRLPIDARVGVTGFGNFLGLGVFFAHDCTYLTRDGKLHRSTPVRKSQYSFCRVIVRNAHVENESRKTIDCSVNDKSPAEFEQHYFNEYTDLYVVSCNSPNELMVSVNINQ